MSRHFILILQGNPTHSMLMSFSFAILLVSFLISSPILQILFMTGFSFNSIMVALAAARDNTSPPKVLEINILSDTLSNISALPVTTDNGIPLAIDLPQVAISGVTL